MRHVVLFVLLLVGCACAQDCKLIVPPSPLTATGLSTPFILESVDPANPCSQIGNGASFVQGAVIDLVTGAISVYNPIVIDKGTTAAAAPVVPQLPQFYVAGLWFGTNGDSLTLVDNSNSLNDGNCVDGTTDSIFGQYSYCNAPAFFVVANSFVQSRKITVPKLGTAQDGQTCPTTRSFFIVDQDQSDNVVTSYLITSTGKIAQNTAANRKTFKNTTVLDNGSDEGLVVLVNAGLGCPSWLVTDLADPTGNALASLPFNELMAAYREPYPVALVPTGDPMVLLANGGISVTKTNAYRIGVGQDLITSAAQASTSTYCKHLVTIFPTRMLQATTKKLLSAQPSPDTALANNLFNFLAQRFVASLQNLNCSAFLNINTKAIMTLTKDADGCVTATAINAELIPVYSFNTTDSGSQGLETAAVCGGAPHIGASFMVLLVVAVWVAL